MNRLATLLIMVLVFTSCASRKKLLTQQRYDEVIERCVKSLIKDPGDEESARQLDQAYRLANERDLSRIKYLKEEGNPDNYDEMFGLYSALKYRQERVRPVNPLHFDGRTVTLSYTNYDAEMIAAKKNAAEYFYNNGKRLMAENTREAYRTAWYQLNKAREYSGGAYPDLDQMIVEARRKGITRALIEIENRTQFRLPPDFIGNVLSFNTDYLRQEWVEYYLTDRDQNIDFDYLVQVNLLNIDISPDRVTEKDQHVTREVDDGFQYVLDARGNVMKDSAGNDIKVKKTKTISCSLIESIQEKSVSLRGEVEFMMLNPDRRLLKKEPIGAESRFTFTSARAIGDVKALSEEQLKSIQAKPVPFPTDYEMIGRCTETLSNAVRDVVYRNRHLIK